MCSGALYCVAWVCLCASTFIWCFVSFSIPIISLFLCKYIYFSLFHYFTTISLLSTLFSSFSVCLFYLNAFFFGASSVFSSFMLFCTYYPLYVLLLSLLNHCIVYTKRNDAYVSRTKINGKKSNNMGNNKIVLTMFTNE